MVEVAIVGAWGLMLLVALWPTISNGTRLLKRWEVPDPSLEEIEEAVRYLKRRRLLYPFLYMGLGTVVGGDVHVRHRGRRAVRHAAGRTAGVAPASALTP